MQLAHKELAPELAKMISSNSFTHLNKLEKVWLGTHIRYQAGDEAFQMIIESHVPGIVIYSLCQLRAQIENRIHQITPDQEKNFYNTSAQTVIRHYQRSTSSLTIPFFGLTSAVAEQIKTSRLS